MTGVALFVVLALMFALSVAVGVVCWKEGYFWGKLKGWDEERTRQQEGHCGTCGAKLEED